MNSILDLKYCVNLKRLFGDEKHIQMTVGIATIRRVKASSKVYISMQRREMRENSIFTALV